MGHQSGGDPQLFRLGFSDAFGELGGPKESGEKKHDMNNPGRVERLLNILPNRGNLFEQIFFSEIL